MDKKSESRALQLAAYREGAKDAVDVKVISETRDAVAGGFLKSLTEKVKANKGVSFAVAAVALGAVAYGAHKMMQRGEQSASR